MTIARRDVLVGAGALALSGCKPGFELKPGTPYDEILARIHTTDSTIDENFTNHAPMVAEALVTLGHEASVVTFLNAYSTSLPPLPAGEVIPPAERDAKLGHGDLRGAWIATYLAEVELNDAMTLLQREWPHLCAGYGADLFHGPIRTAHALRALGRENTQERRAELAHGLGHWSAWDVRIPGTVGASARAGFDLVQALDAVPLVPESERKKSSSVATTLSPLIDRTEFIAAIEAVDLDVWPVERSITELAAACSRLMLRQTDIVVLHTITGTSALRLLLPLLTPMQQREALACAFHAVAGFLAVNAKEAGIPASATPSTSTWDEQVARAKTSQDAHVIKLIEAGQREFAIDPRPEFLAAAARWGGR